jgi:MYXO-CTERM domain-containing protein
MRGRYAGTLIVTLALAGSGFGAIASAADDAPACTIICPGRGDFCVGCGRGELSAFLALAPVCEPECTPYEAQKTFWRGFDRAEVARCVMDAARDADSPDDSGGRRRYLGVEVSLDIAKSGAVVVSAAALREGLSSARARDAWPRLRPVITTCITKALQPVRLERGNAVEPSKLNLQVDVSAATGSGGPKSSGCRCSVSGSEGGGDAPSWLALAALLGGLLATRRSRVRLNRSESPWPR